MFMLWGPPHRGKLHSIDRTCIVQDRFVDTFLLLSMAEAEEEVLHEQEVYYP